MFCTNCGKQLNDGANFCSGCGTKIGGSQNQEIFVTTPVQKLEQQKNIEPEKKLLQKYPKLAVMGKFALTTICIIAISLLMLGVYILIKSRAERVSENVTSQPNIQVLKENAQAAFNRGDHNEAINLYSQVIQLESNNEISYYNRGIAYHDLGDYDRAIADYTHAIQLDTNFAEAYYNRGFIYFDKEDYDRAIADYNQLIRINPNDADAYNSRGVAYVYKGDNDRAIADYNQAIRLNPNHELAYDNRAYIYMEQRRYLQARVDINRALQINPNFTSAQARSEELRRLGY